MFNKFQWETPHFCLKILFFILLDCMSSSSFQRWIKKFSFFSFAPLTKKESTIFKTLYGEAELSERIHAQLFKLILASKASGTLSSYIASINRWLVFARKNNYWQFPPKSLHFSLYLTDLSEEGPLSLLSKCLKPACPSIMKPGTVRTSALWIRSLSP